MLKDKRILLIGSLPYSNSNASRAFSTYFDNLSHYEMRQIFSSNKVPTKGHCSSFYRITDIDMVKSWLLFKKAKGNIYYSNKIEVYDLSSKKSSKKRFINYIYKIGSRKSSIVYILRALLWSFNKWKSSNLNEWINEFKPNLIFLAFSDDLYLLNIAYEYSKEYNAPIITSIGDDYYFRKYSRLSIFMRYYTHIYQKKVDKFFSLVRSVIYIDDKIKNKYQSHFHTHGVTVRLTSSFKPRKFMKIDLCNPKITYIGNIRLGRNASLVMIAKELEKINSKYKIDLYTNETDNFYLKPLRKCQNIDIHGSIAYEKVESILHNSDISLILESFEKKDVNFSRFSLSTKIADSLAAGVNLYAVGSIDCGAIEYLYKNKCAEVCTNPLEIANTLNEFLLDENKQYQYYINAIRTLNLNHNVEINKHIVPYLINEILGEENE